MEDHKTVSTDNYDVTFHPAFASSCVIEPTGGTATKLYEQDKTKPVDCKAKGHPKKHVIKLKGKGNKRDITITIDDPNHSIHRLSIDLYDEARDPATEGTWEATDTFTVMNTAFTCPPYCDTDPPA